MTDIVSQIEEAARTNEDIADNLERLCKAAGQLLKTKLTTETVVRLLVWKSGVGIGDVRRIIIALSELRSCLKKTATSKAKGK